MLSIGGCCYAKGANNAQGYLELRGKLRNGEIKTEKIFREASEQYWREYDIMTQGQRSKEYVGGL